MKTHHSTRGRLLPRVIHVAAFSAAFALLGSSVQAAAADTRPWLDTSLPSETRAQMMVDQMTLEEKSGLLYGYGTRVVGGQTWQVYVKGIDRLGIPDMVQGDAPSGIWQGSSDVTQLPNSTALGATFSTDAAAMYGDVIGTETRALGYGVIHGPNVDVLRDPRHGRAHETIGEDPVLVGDLATQYVTSVQNHDVIADGKHFAVNTAEKDRMTADSQLSRKALYELYLAPFQDVVQDGKVGMLMCSYTKINGVQSCDNEETLVEVLREAWGFKGIVRTDAGAAHSLNSLALGVDQEFRSESQFGTVLINAVNNGTFPIEAVDASIKRILGTMIDYGIFDNPPQRTGAPLADDAAKAQSIAEQSIVLLKNDDSLLPLDDSVSSIAVVGTNADDTLAAGGPTNPSPVGKDTLLQALTARADAASVTYDRGVDPIYGIATDPGYPQLNSGYLRAADGTTLGADARYLDASGAVLQTRVDPCLCNSPATSFAGTVSTAQAAPQGTASATWSATVVADVAGTYGVDLVTGAAASLSIDGAPVVSIAAGRPGSPSQAQVELAAGDHSIVVEYTGNASTSLKVGWQAPAASRDANIEAAVAAASEADVAIVVARDLESESIDRPSLTLPNDQNRLISAVLAANPNTVVVLNTGSAITMPWKDEAPSIVEAWYGGTRGGAATAAVLFGDVNPSGRLPITFPESTEDLPTSSAQQFPGVDKVVSFSEGLSTGYRYFGKSGAPTAAFAFGSGLSYTTFGYSELKVSSPDFVIGAPGSDGTFKGQKAVTASVTVTNTGSVSGTATPQLYIDFPGSAGQPAPLLKGFDKTELAPGESKVVEFVLDQRDFSNYLESGDRGAWTVAEGDYTLLAGDSSVSRPLAVSVTAAAAVDSTPTTTAPTTQTGSNTATGSDKLAATGSGAGTVIGFGLLALAAGAAVLLTARRRRSMNS